MGLVFEQAGLLFENGDKPIIFWRNIVTAARLSDTQGTSDPDFPVTNLANAGLTNKWKQDVEELITAPAHDSPAVYPAYITLDITGAGLIDYVAIAGHNLGTISATVALEGGESNYSPVHHDSPPVGEYVTGFVPTDDSPIIFKIEAVEQTMLRLRIENLTTTPAQISVMYAGYSMTLAEGIQADHIPLPLAKTRKSVIGQSENGSFLGRIVLGEWVQSKATFANLESPWVRDELVPFLEFAAEFPFFYAWSPETYPNETAFAWLDGDPAPSFDIDGYAAIELDMKGVVE